MKKKEVWTILDIEGFVGIELFTFECSRDA